MSTIFAELFMVLIVLIMSTIVFAFYSGVFSALLAGPSFHPENFTVIEAGSPSAGINASAVQPVGNNNNFHYSTSGTICTSTITTNVNVYVPPGASCTINAVTVQSINVNHGASLTLNGTTLQSINLNYGASLTISGGNIQSTVNDNYSSTIVISNNALMHGISLYGTGSFSMTGSQTASGSVTMNGVVYATYSTSNLGGTFTVQNSGSVQIDSSTISGAVSFTNDQYVRVTNTTINGTLTFNAVNNCYTANNTVSGTITGTCTGGAPSGGLDVLNTGASTISFNTLYLDSQPWSGVSWQLASGSTEQCGSALIAIGPCTLFPIVVPPNTMVLITFSWVNPTPTSQVEILMWTTARNYLESRVDPTAGLVCSSDSIYPPREPIGFC